MININRLEIYMEFENKYDALLPTIGLEGINRVEFMKVRNFAIEQGFTVVDSYYEADKRAAFLHFGSLVLEDERKIFLQPRDEENEINRRIVRKKFKKLFFFCLKVVDYLHFSNSYESFIAIAYQGGVRNVIPEIAVMDFLYPDSVLSPVCLITKE